MSRSAPHIVLLLVLFICFRGSLGSGSGVGEPKIKCKTAERKALLRIKQDFFADPVQGYEDPNVVLSSWGEEEEKRECCEWIGIQCSNSSGRVIKLDLSPSTFHRDVSSDYHFLFGNISSSIVDLKHLSHLDLSHIYFGEFSSIPRFIGRLTKLRYLNLSSTSLGGETPSQLGNLSSLQFLGLSDTNLKIKSLNWVSRLSSLRVLDLSGTNMSLANDWVHVITNPPRFLTTLLLNDCDLPDIVTPTSRSLFNSSEVLTVLNLSENPFSRSIFQWLFYYNTSLLHLDLSNCWNVGGPIPNGFNNMAALKYLDLSENGFEGIIPDSFGNMSALTYLDLNYNHLRGSIPQSFGNMVALKYLRLSGNSFEGIIPDSFGNLISLTYLGLDSNQLDGLHPRSFGNMTALTYLDLSYNQLRGSIPESFGSMTTIQYLSFHSNNLKGPIPEHFGNMSSLGHLDLSNNMLEGEIPKSIWKICTLRRFEAYNNSLTGDLRFAQLNSSMSCANFSLEYLDLNQNKIVGPLPDFTLHPSLIELHLSSNQFSGISNSMGQLSKLEIMDFSENSIQDVISEAHFAKLFNLKYLDLSANSNLALNIPSDWIPPFQLEKIYLGSCKLGPHFPNWLQTQKNHYWALNISYSGILDPIPDWLWDFNPDLYLLDLSNNGIRGIIHDVKKKFHCTEDRYGKNCPEIHLSSNQLQGPIPQFLFEVASSLYLFNNSFSQLDSLCNITDTISLLILDVSYNQLSGELPDCWSQAVSLRILFLENNNLSGKIPVSIGFLFYIRILHLGNNSFTAELPSTLMNCTGLVVFDVGENKLSGPIPTWIGTSLTNLIIISLRSNHFNGSMPSQLCHLVDLQLLDLSSNDLSGEILECLGNITAMKQIGSGDPYPDFPLRRWAGIPSDFNKESLVLVWKGSISEFKNVRLLKNIDLSSNKLTGEIPRGVMTLVQLISFNLSRNNLSGHIPQEIGRLKSLDVLDLSNNYLFGQIPSSLSQVDRLSTLDLSYNNLSGKIPEGTQLQTRDASAFLGNPQLCGNPLPKKCPNEEHPSIPNGVTEDGYKDELITKGFYIGLAIGFVVGFWGLCGTLIFNKSLRYAYLKLLNDTGDWIHVTKEVHKRKLLRWIQN